MVGWIGPNLGKFSDIDTPLLSGPLTNEQLSWVGSIGAIGIFFGSFSFGLITSFIGCKRATHLTAIPAMSVWILIYFGSNYYQILLVCFSIGFMGGALQSTLILYISEIANDE